MRLFKKISGTDSRIALFDDDMTLVKPVFKYLYSLRESGKAPNTIASYASDLKIFWEFLKYYGISFDQLTPAMVPEFIAYLRTSPRDNLINPKNIIRKATTINRILKTVHGFYQFFSLIAGSDNPMPALKAQQSVNAYKGFLDHARKDNFTYKSYFKVKEYEEKDEDFCGSFRIITKDQFNLILSALSNKRDKLLFQVLYYSGARISEALSIKVDDIPIPNSRDVCTVIFVKQHKSASKDQQFKGPDKRRLFVPTFLVSEIDNYILSERSKLAMTNDDGFLFISYQKRLGGKPLTHRSVYDKYKKVAQLLGLKHFTPHTLRHTCCTNLIAAGVHLAKVQKIMNHRSISTTMRYTHLVTEDIRRTLDEYWSTSIFTGNE